MTQFKEIIAPFTAFNRNSHSIYVHNSTIPHHQCNISASFRYMFGMWDMDWDLVTSTEKAFTKKFIIELYNKKEWFPETLQSYDLALLPTKYHMFESIRLVGKHWCKLWKKHRVKGERMIKTIKRISDTENIENSNYLFDIIKTIKENADNKKIHAKFIKENNVKLKEQINSYLDNLPGAILNQEQDIIILKKKIKNKELFIKDVTTRLNYAKDMKSILLFPSVCKGIYSIFSQNPSRRTEEIFKYPTDITIDVINILLNKKV